MPSTRSICRFVFVPAAILLLAFGFALAQTTPAPSPTPNAAPTPTLEKQFFKNILRDQKAIWTFPFHLKGDDARWAVPIGLGTAALITTDRITGDEMAEPRGQLKASRIVSYAGSTYVTGGAAAAFYFIGRASHNRRARETGILSAEALVDSLIVANALKAATQRVRPLDGRDRSEFFDGGTSFPSGHSIQAWSVATVIAQEYHDRPAVQMAAYGIASAVSVARFTGLKHYLSDVLVGTVMGYGIGKYVYHTHHHRAPGSTGGEEEEEARHSRRWPAILPDYNRHRREYGVALAWRF